MLHMGGESLILLFSSCYSSWEIDDDGRLAGVKDLGLTDCRETLWLCQTQPAWSVCLEGFMLKPDAY